MSKLPVFLFSLGVVSALFPDDKTIEVFENSENEFSLKSTKLEEFLNPKPCCFPEQWEGFVSSSVGEATRFFDPKFRVTTAKIYSDETKQRFAGDLICPKTKSKMIHFVGNFEEDGLNLYAFPLNQTEKCWKKNIPGAKFQKTCIPNTATFDGTFNLGPEDGNQTVNSFSFSGEQYWGNAIVTNKCVPVVFREAGKIKQKKSSKQLFFKSLTGCGLDCLKQKSFTVSAYYINIKLSLPPKDVFIIPDFCKKFRVFDSQANKIFDNLTQFLEFVAI